MDTQKVAESIYEELFGGVSFEADKEEFKLVAALLAKVVRYAQIAKIREVLERPQ